MPISESLSAFASVNANQSSRHHHHRLENQRGLSPHLAGNSTTPVPRHHLHHHHRADGTIHFHPPSKYATPHHKIPRVPLIQVNNASIYESVHNLPRRHLGSVLYSPRIESEILPVGSGTKSACTTAPYTIPRCDGKENCTLTVRIPRFYLSKEKRRQVCENRAVWGTDVYSDDSDPLAAAIHAGWIRGEWRDNVDPSMLELNSSNELETKDTTHTSVPPTPILPALGRDLHLTLLILPTLQKYTSRVAHGIKSRPWGSNHDGLSYQIQKVAWVDEQSSRGEGRGGESRHKRLKTTSEFRPVAPPLRLGIGKALGKSMVATAAA